METAFHYNHVSEHSHEKLLLISSRLGQYSLAEIAILPANCKPAGFFTTHKYDHYHYPRLLLAGQECFRAPVRAETTLIDPYINGGEKCRRFPAGSCSCAGEKGARGGLRRAGGQARRRGQLPAGRASTKGLVSWWHLKLAARGPLPLARLGRAGAGCIPAQEAVGRGCLGQPLTVCNRKKAVPGRQRFSVLPHRAEEGGGDAGEGPGPGLRSLRHRRCRAAI